MTGRASGPAPTPAAGGVPRPRLEVEVDIEVNLTSLARPPSPAELRAISLAVEEALRALTEPAETGRRPLAFIGTLVELHSPALGSGRLFVSGARPQRFSPVVDELWKTMDLAGDYFDQAAPLAGLHLAHDAGGEAKPTHRGHGVAPPGRPARPPPCRGPC